MAVFALFLHAMPFWLVLGKTDAGCSVEITTKTTLSFTSSFFTFIYCQANIEDFVLWKYSINDKKISVDTEKNSVRRKPVNIFFYFYQV